MRYLLIVIFILTLTVPAAAGRDYQGSCDISFYGRTTFKGFQGTVSCQPFSITEVNGFVEGPVIHVRVAEMDTNNARRDTQLRKMFEEEHFPLITGRADRIPIEDIFSLLQRGASTTTEVSFQLTIRDITHPVTATIKNLIETEASITAELGFAVSLAAYQLSPPSFLGIIKVADIIEATANFVLLVDPASR